MLFKCTFEKRQFDDMFVEKITSKMSVPFSGTQIQNLFHVCHRI